MHNKIRIKTQLKNKPIIEPVSLDEAKLYLRITNNKEDSLIISLIKAARNIAENYLRMSLLTQEWQAYCMDFINGNIHLPKGPVQSVESIFTFKNNGVKSMISPEIYSLNKMEDIVKFQYPIINNGLYINYTTGYKKISEVPEAITHGIKEHIVSVYEGRGSVNALPSNVKNLYQSYRKILI